MATLGLDRASLSNLLSTLTERGRSLLGLSNGARAMSQAELIGLGETLLSRRGEATGVALANTLLAGYSAASEADQLAFLNALADLFGPDMNELNAALAVVRDKGTTPDAISKLLKAAEPRRQELIRRLNLAPGGTASLVRMREALLTHIKDHPALKHVDSDFVHLFASWFNRGFLVLQRIDWTTPANILEKIIRYEQVHAISNWDDLRSRLAPSDRRCYGFFHPQLVDEPLIFVEVALTRESPAAIAPLLDLTRAPIPATDATTAVFYSISNTQRGLGGISFGNFLIKQVVEEIKRELPNVHTFVTLSPVPGFAAWLTRERASETSPLLDGASRAILNALDTPNWADDPDIAEQVKAELLPLAAYYFIEAKGSRGHPLDPVARFHLGNGARLERLNFLGDRSEKGMQQSYGLMVNYLYALDQIEANHEAFAEKGQVASSSAVRKMLPARALAETSASA
ncbi:MAG TPA: MCD, Malonyl-CoA decarboxylase MCD [Afipia sp.]|uniref:malonyl-CoA decarboxylase n=1 Tax=unclassified Afipia TaxID=2642050 RepID=UPI00046590A6|nr:MULTISPECIES: malonyl-CoA decarboxylase [unclassified Afipia]MAH70523.1 MCD, Malonyl-CoA decarboxylase MCD [Afipia sp.]OUX60341.1 MAG: MCD, Malonyl-CoA decarboxylase MCD [Afipia sp. TMED4]HAO39452.1 MCD, Malonyl-CoA decarboxylase MCD [Afipia sp.]HAP11253.1 MCD, Malonyl-CoA decarboxylase MCD [Afipia sp.]HBF53965.1 MCD, Malonyl-CoA decarboxylase MCD [Afipia sp.]